MASNNGAQEFLVRGYSSVFCLKVKPWCSKHKVSAVVVTPITTVPTAAVVVTSHSVTGSHAHTQPLTLTHSYTHAHTHSHIHTHTHTHTHTPATDSLRYSI